MNILLNRFAVGLPTGTFGALAIDGVFYCFTLEPIMPVIPAGTWPVLMVDSPTHTPKYGYMPWVNWKVPGPTHDGSYQSPENEGGHTLIHIGNTIADTTGCILPGILNMFSHCTPMEFIGVYESKQKFTVLQERINAEMINGVTMEINTLGV